MTHRITRWCTALAAGAAGVSAAATPMAPRGGAERAEIVAVTRAAKAGVAEFIREGGAAVERLGFSTSEDRADATVGECYEMVTIAPAALLDASRPAEIEQLATPLGQWQCIVSVRGDARVLMTIANVEGHWQAVSLGAGDLAKEIAGARALHARADHYENRLVRIYQASADFMHVSQNGRSLGVLPLKSLKARQPATPLASLSAVGATELQPLSDVLTDLRPIVKQRMEGTP